MIKTLNKHLLLALLLLALAQVTYAVRVKDITSIRGARDNQLTGFGLVFGLDGTGDSPESLLSRKPVINALERMGNNLDRTDITGRSISAVWITAILPPFAKAGQKIDITVSTIGDTTSLRGGVLTMSPLRAPNRLVYAVAQGPVVGIPRGISRVEVPLEPKELKKFGDSLVASVGFVQGGAIVEREINLNLNSRSRIYLNINEPDFTTADRLTNLINRVIGFGTAKPKDAGTIEISIPDSYLGKTVELLSYIENLEINPDNVSRVILDERTGTIIMGGDVRISPVAISQGSMSIEVRIPQDESQKNQTTRGQDNKSDVPGNVFLFKGGADLKDIIDGFNKIGAKSSDLMHVLKNIKKAGKLHAQLVVR